MIEKKSICFFPIAQEKEFMSFQEKFLKSIEVTPESRIFLSHITFFRIKDPQLFAPYQLAILEAVKDIVFSFPVSNIRLYCSIDQHRQVPLVDFSVS